jgi:hypothetical protein
MKTLLYETRYYLFVTLLVILLLPDKTETPKKPDTGADINPISTLRNDPHQITDENKHPLKRTSQSVQRFFPDKETKSTETKSEKKTKDLFPEPNRY